MACSIDEDQHWIGALRPRQSDREAGGYGMAAPAAVHSRSEAVLLRQALSLLSKHSTVRAVNTLSYPRAASTLQCEAEKHYQL
jgi:hypothetical protein